MATDSAPTYILSTIHRLLLFQPMRVVFFHVGSRNSTTMTTTAASSPPTHQQSTTTRTHTLRCTTWACPPTCSRYALHKCMRQPFFDCRIDMVGYTRTLDKEAYAREHSTQPLPIRKDKRCNARCNARCRALPVELFPAS